MGRFGPLFGSKVASKLARATPSQDRWATFRFDQHLLQFRRLYPLVRMPSHRSIHIFLRRADISHQQAQVRVAQYLCKDRQSATCQGEPRGKCVAHIVQAALDPTPTRFTLRFPVDPVMVESQNLPLVMLTFLMSPYLPIQKSRNIKMIETDSIG